MLLDASAVLALLFSETGSDTVATALQQHDCRITAANQAEVIAKLIDRGLAQTNVHLVLSSLSITVVDNSVADGEAAGYMRSASKPIGLSLGDRLCLAAGQRLKTPVMTADQAWLGLSEALGLNIICIRAKRNT
jgi:PIN domain nuclease of toxin-antitoxin system